ncbi:MAG: hypothetical protein C4539_12595 [Ignavibacteriales bacterium]|nr:MAG: hypothetical protein C4539_12595 [Ignavibacteriales bacterium]
MSISVTGSRLSYLIIILLLLITVSDCKKDNNPTESNNNGNSNGNGDGNGTSTDANQSRNENWLLGTWEGTTPEDAAAPFNNKKVRMVLTAVKLATETHPAETQTSRTYAYTGTITWDAGGNEEWAMAIYEKDFLSNTGGGSVDWGCTTSKPSNMFTESISIRAFDTTNVTPLHNISLDWGPAITNSSSSYSYLDLYGDIEADYGSNEQFVFTPEKVLRLTKK